MTLRKKTLWIIGLICITLVLVMYVLSVTLLMDDFYRLENKIVRQDVARVHDAITESLDSLNAYAGDYAKWDDTCVFIQNKNEAYIKANLVNATFVKLRLNLMAFINTSGKMVQIKAVDWRGARDISIPEGMMKHLSPNNLLSRHQSLDSNVKGIILLPQGPMLVTSQPILTSEENGPIRGALIFGRFLDTQEIKRLGDVTHSSVSLRLLNGQALPTDFVTAQESLLAKETVAVLPLNEQTVAGYTVIQDIYKQPGVILKIEVPRDVYKEGLGSIRDLMVSLLIAAVVFGIAIIVLVEKSILFRLFRISRDINSIEASQNLSTRLTVSGKDELAKLAETINSMLQALEKSGVELKDSEARYHAVVEQVSEVIILVEADTKKIVEVNPAFERLFGYGGEEIPNLTLYDIEEYDPSAVDENIKGLVKTGNPYMGERRGRHKDGRLINIELSANLIFYRGRQLLCMIVRDITERKAAREALSRANDDLEMRVLDRTLELGQSNKALQAEIAERAQRETELRRALEAAEVARLAKSEFLANMSHEIRTPMNGIIGMTDLALENPSTTEQKEYLDLVKESANSLLTIISDILDFSAIDAHKLQMQTVAFTFQDCIRDALATLTSKAGNKGLKLEQELDSNIPETLLGDLDHLRQVLTLLVGNAIKFTEKGYIKVRVDRISQTPDKVYLQFTVSDTGIGIPSEKQKTIFEAFSQADGSVTRKYGGTGLGLTISASIISLMGGKIRVESPIGETQSSIGGPGSAFHFTLAFKVPVKIVAGIR
ncbi:MAG: CHASE4 domain-containing protein [Phycisphaerae bacterium]